MLGNDKELQNIKNGLYRRKAKLDFRKTLKNRALSAFKVT